MPKIRTTKSISKRLRTNKKGTISKLHASYRHLLAKKSSNRKRQHKDRTEGLDKSDLKRLKNLI
jgi:ribosomal protein L35